MLTSFQRLPLDAWIFPLRNKSNTRQAAVFLASTHNVALPQQTNILQNLLSTPLLITQKLDANHSSQSCIYPRRLARFENCVESCQTKCVP
jgi:hypothetical protein